MSFPSKINTKISGSLKLTIAKPELDVVYGGSDSDTLELPVPLGFSVNKGLKEQVKVSIESARERLDEITEKSLNCTNCRKTPNSHVLTAHMLLTRIADVSKFTDDKFHLMLGQNENSEITINVLYSNRQCCIIVGNMVSSCGFYRDDNLVNENLELDVDDGISIIMFLVGMES